MYPKSAHFCAGCKFEYTWCIDVFYLFNAPVRSVNVFFKARYIKNINSLTRYVVNSEIPNK